MILIRRELPRTTIVGHRGLTPLRHIVSPRILHTAPKPMGSSPRPSALSGVLPRRRGHLLPDGPDEARQLPGHCRDGDARHFPPVQQPPVTPMQADLGLAG